MALACGRSPHGMAPRIPVLPELPQCRQPPRAMPLIPRNPAGVSPLARHPASAPGCSPQAEARQPSTGLEARRRCTLPSPSPHHSPSVPRPPPAEGRPGKPLRQHQEGSGSHAEQSLTQRSPHTARPLRVTPEDLCSKAPQAGKPAPRRQSRGWLRHSHGATAISWKAQQHRSRHGNRRPPHRASGLAATGSPEQLDTLIKLV